MWIVIWAVAMRATMDALIAGTVEGLMKAIPDVVLNLTAATLAAQHRGGAVGAAGAHPRMHWAPSLTVSAQATQAITDGSGPGEQSMWEQAAGYVRDRAVAAAWDLAADFALRHLRA